MRCVAINPDESQCQKEAVKAIKLTHSHYGTQIQCLCQEHYEMGKTGEYPQVVVVTDTLTERQITMRTEDIDMPTDENEIGYSAYRVEKLLYMRDCFE